MAFTHALSVRFRDCDMLGHVNNAVYLTYFEEARSAYWRSMMGPAFSGYGFILAEATCSYRSSAVVGEGLEIALRVAEVGNKSFTFRYRITERSSGREVARGRTVQVMYDYESKVSVPIPSEVRTRLEAFEARMSPPGGDAW